MKDCSDAMRKVDGWGTENVVDAAFIQSLEFAEGIQRQVLGIHTKITQLKDLTEKSHCDNPELVEYREKIVASMDSELNDLETSLDMYVSQNY